MPVLKFTSEFASGNFVISNIQTYEDYKKACDDKGLDHEELQYEGRFDFTECTYEDRCLALEYLMQGGDLKTYLDICETCTTIEKAKIYAMAAFDITYDLEDAKNRFKNVVICEKKELKKPHNLSYVIGKNLQDLVPFIKVKKIVKTCLETGQIGKFEFAGKNTTS